MLPHTGAKRRRRALVGSASLALVLEIALGLRLLRPAHAIDLYVHRGGSQRLCLFPDTVIYWGLANTIRLGIPYEYVEWNDIPHFAIRTPGYPLLAACHTVFGERTLAVRLAHVLGPAPHLVYRLTYQITAPLTCETSDRTSSLRRWTAPLAAAAMSNT